MIETTILPGTNPGAESGFVFSVLVGLLGGVIFLGVHFYGGEVS